MTNDKIIQQVRMNASRQLRVNATETRRAKQQEAKERVEFDLFMEDCKANGIDINKPESKALALQGWMIKLGQLRREEDEEPILTDGDIFLR
jgi:hypothetical protein